MICNSSVKQNNCVTDQFNESDQTNDFVNIDEINQTANFDVNFDVNSDINFDANFNQTDKIDKINEF